MRNPNFSREELETISNVLYAQSLSLYTAADTPAVKSVLPAYEAMRTEAKRLKVMADSVNAVLDAKG